MAAYFDVDGTITPLTTMFELLRFDAAASQRREEATAFLGGLRAMKERGVPRSETNAAYFEWWTGRDVDEVDRLGREWFKSVMRCQSSEWIHGAVWDQIKGHKAAGHRIVFVSGSFSPALSSLAEFVGAHDVIASQPYIQFERYTGSIDAPMISHEKARAVSAHAKNHGLRLDICSAYGDDASDLPFMELVGNRFAVADPTSDFAATAKARGINRISIRKAIF